MNTLYEHLSDHAKSRWSMPIVFLWGFAEATAFFIVPDIYMGLVALFHWRRGITAAFATLFGAMLGGAVMYLLATNNPTGINTFLTHIPLIDAALVNDVASQTHAHGLSAVLMGPVRGTPYKIYAAQAGEQSLPLFYFLLMTIVARGERFFPVVLVLGGLGTWFQNFLQNHTKLVVGGYVLMWCLIYSVFIARFVAH